MTMEKVLKEIKSFCITYGEMFPDHMAGRH